MALYRAPEAHDVSQRTLRPGSGLGVGLKGKDRFQQAGVDGIHLRFLGSGRLPVEGETEVAIHGPGGPQTRYSDRLRRTAASADW